MLLRKTMHFTEDEYAAIEVVAREAGLSIPVLLRKAIRDYLDLSPSPEDEDDDSREDGEEIQPPS